MSDTENILRPLPHSVGSEKSILSLIFQYPEMIDDAPTLTDAHFYLPGPRIIFEQIQEFTAAGKPMEMSLFIQHLIDRGLLDRIGGLSALCDVWNYQPATETFQAHLGFLNDKLARRMTIAAANEMERVAYESAEPSEILEVTSAPITAIHDLLTSTRPERSTKAVLAACMDRFQLLCSGKADPMGMETSLIEINRRFRGLHPKQTVVISGYPGGGKTTLAAQLALDAATDGHNSLICSLEMPEEKMMERIIAYVSRLPGLAITDPIQYARENYDTAGPTTGMIQAIQSACIRIKDSPLAIEDLIGANVYQIGACIRRAHRKSPLKVVVVDYAQRIRPAPEMKRESREQQLAHASNHLADLSKELGFCLLLPSQLNKEGATKHAETLNEDADLHLQIVQDRSGPAPTFNHQGIAVMKDRHNGQDGNLIPIVLNGPMLRFIPKPFTA